MITGFNTDVEYNGVTYHVQTEDKGLGKPLILSLVYTGGEILASKRSPYDDLITAGFDEKVLSERLNRQHKLICAAIKQGRIEDLRRMSMTNSPAVTETKPVEIVQPALNSNDSDKDVIRSTQLPVLEESLSDALLEIPVEVLDETPIFPDITLEAGATQARAENQNDRESVAPQANKSEPKIAGFNDEVENQTQNLPEQILGIKLLEEREFRGGERAFIQILVARKSKAVCHCDVMIKILGSSFRPQIFHTKTDEKGVASINLQLPHFKSGRAAILIRAESGGVAAELRRIVVQG